MTVHALALPHHEISTSETRDVSHYGQVTTQRDSQSRERSTDASRLTFPLQLVIVIVTATLTASGVVWAERSGQQELRSDVRDIKTAMDGFTRYQNSMTDDLRREQALQKIRLEETRNALAELKGYLAAGGKGLPK